MPAEAVVVQAFRPAVSGRPEGLHYFRRFFHRRFFHSDHVLRTPQSMKWIG